MREWEWWNWQQTCSCFHQFDWLFHIDNAGNGQSPKSYILKWHLDNMKEWNTANPNNMYETILMTHLMILNRLIKQWKEKIYLKDL